MVLLSHAWQPDDVALLNETFNATEKDVSMIVSENRKLQATVATLKIQVASYEKEVERDSEISDADLMSSFQELQ